MVICTAKSKTLPPIIREKVQADSLAYLNYWRGENILDLSESKHYRINHLKLFANERKHINGIENSWDQTKRHMRKFKGIPAEYFPLFLKGCEWPFNNPNPKAQLKQLKQWVKKYMG